MHIRTRVVAGALAALAAAGCAAGTAAAQAIPHAPGQLPFASSAVSTARPSFVSQSRPAGSR